MIKTKKPITRLPLQAYETPKVEKFNLGTQEDYLVTASQLKGYSEDNVYKEDF